MKNLFLMLAFMLAGTFGFANIPVNGDFPEYDSSLKIAEEDCACDGAFTSCSADGWCACSCGWFSCSCETHGSNTGYNKGINLFRQMVNEIDTRLAE